MPPKGKSYTWSVTNITQMTSVLTSEVWVLIDRFLIPILSERAKDLQVVIGARTALSVVEVPELGQDELAVATVLVQIGSAWGRVGLVVLEVVSPVNRRRPV